MIDLLQKAHDLQLSRIAIRPIRLSDSEIEALNARLHDDPYDLVARTTLLSYYNRRAYSNSVEVKVLSAVRFEHLSWFIDNMPDSEFCGELAFYLLAADDHYKALTASWLEQISRSNNLERRVNAYMLYAFNKYSGLPELFAQWFSQFADSLWVEALASLNQIDQPWQSRIIKEWHSESPVISASSVLGITSEKLPLRRIAGTVANKCDYSSFRKYLIQWEQAPSDLEVIARLLGYTAVNCETSSALGVSPPLVALRFKLMCWIVCQIPDADFAGCSFAIDPFSDLRQLNDCLASLWLSQVDHHAESHTFLRNIATFAYRLPSSALSRRDEIFLSINKYNLGVCTSNRFDDVRR